MQQLIAIVFALLILLTGMGLLAWLVASGLWAPINPLAAGLFALTTGVFWLLAAWRLFERSRARAHILSAAALLMVATILELGLGLLTGHYTGVGLTLAVLGSSGGLVFTIASGLMAGES